MNDLATVMFVAGAVTHRTVKVGLRALAIAAAWADARLLPIDSIALLRYSNLKLAWLEVRSDSDLTSRLRCYSLAHLKPPSFSARDRTAQELAIEP